eukprot:ANDGO_03295.mRNA.1 Calreticulin
MSKLTCLFVVLGLVAAAHANSYFTENFDDSWTSRWTYSKHKEAEGTAGKFKHTAGKWFGGKESDAKGIQTSQDARFYQISAPFTNNGVYSNEGKDFVLQFTVKHEQSLDCGGGYIKVLPKGLDQTKFNGDSDYNIMFGPDICGSTTRRIHLIFNYKGTNLLWKKDVRCETDQLSHVYTLIVHPDNTYKVLVDNQERAAGSLYEDWDFLPAKQIDDLSVSKPEDWDEREEIADPADHKPEGWDNTPATIEDPNASKPADWDDEEDGEWKAPRIPNPEYKGEWKARMIKNPAYKGKWSPPKIDNPEFKDDPTIYVQKDMAFVGFEIWQVKAGTIFDAIYVGDSVEEAKALAEKSIETFKEEKNVFDKVEEQRRAKEEEERKKLEEERKKREEEDKKKKEAEKADDDEEEEEFKDEL